LNYFSGKLVYAMRAGGVWILENVPEPADARRPSLSLDSQGRPHIAYGATTPSGFFGLKYATRDGAGWRIEEVEAGNIGYLSYSLALDPDDQPHIAYTGLDANFDSSVVYATRGMGGWAKETLEFYRTGSGMSLAFDSQNRPHMSYVNWGRGELRHAVKNGASWLVEIVETGVEGYTPGGFQLEILPGSDGTIHICYENSGKIWYSSGGGSGWVTEPVDNGFAPSIVLDRGNRPHVSYSSGYYGDIFPDVLKHAWKVGQQWNIEVSDQSWVSQFTSLAIDGGGDLHVLYFLGNSGIAPTRYGRGVLTP